MNHNCQHTDAAWRALLEEIAELRRALKLSGQVLRKAIAEIEEFIQERTA